MTAAQLYRLAPMLAHDDVDARLMALYVALRGKLTVRGRHAILAGVAGFQRVIE